MQIRCVAFKIQAIAAVRLGNAIPNCFLLEGPVRPVGLGSYIPINISNAEQCTSRQGAFICGPVSGPGTWDRGHTQVESEPDHLPADKDACVGQEGDLGHGA
jgi:hypothetical protein